MSEARKILIADDDRLTREMFRIILQREGYELLFAEDGATAVEMALREKPDLVITDGLLPKLHGFLVCKTLKESDPAPKVVIVTAVYTKPTYKWEMKKEYGADDVLKKPFKPAELLTTIERQLSEGGAVPAAPVEQVLNESDANLLLGESFAAR
jgi:DNA-binding response OmpR family regulator